MSGAGLRQRLAVFALFAALAAAGLSALVAGVPAAAPAVSDLAALEAKMAANARLHPAAPTPVPAGPAAWCAECHPGLPHPGTGVAAALLNDHAGRMDCLLCHWSAANGERPRPAWQVQADTSAVLTVLPRERASKDQLVALRAAAATGRPCFERGPSCAGCHRPGGIGGLARPGSSPERSASLERLEKYFTLAPGEKWYFPSFP